MGGGISHPLIAGTTSAGPTQEGDHEHGVDQQHIFYRVARFVAALTARLRSQILGTPDAPFGATMPKSGEAGPVPLRADQTRSASPCTDTTVALVSAPVTPRRIRA